MIGNSLLASAESISTERDEYEKKNEISEGNRQNKYRVKKKIESNATLVID